MHCTIPSVCVVVVAACGVEPRCMHGMTNHSHQPLSVPRRNAQSSHALPPRSGPGCRQHFHVCGMCGVCGCMPHVEVLPAPCASHMLACRHLCRHPCRSSAATIGPKSTSRTWPRRCWCVKQAGMPARGRPCWVVTCRRSTACARTRTHGLAFFHPQHTQPAGRARARAHTHAGSDRQRTASAAAAAAAAAWGMSAWQ